MTSSAESSTQDTFDREIDRYDTGIRLLLSLLFAFIRGLVDSVVGLIVVFSLLWAFITRQPPSERLRALANRIVTFDYRVGRYLTYNESSVPFPFSDFPQALEASTWTPDARESEDLGVPRRTSSEREDWED